MKIRQGFISNSSSSSFILSAPVEGDKIVFKIDKKFKSFFKTENELLKFLKNYICFDDLGLDNTEKIGFEKTMSLEEFYNLAKKSNKVSKWQLEVIEKTLKVFSDGKALFELDVPYGYDEDDLFTKLLTDGKFDDVKIEYSFD